MSTYLTEVFSVTVWHELGSVYNLVILIAKLGIQYNEKTLT